MLNQITAGAPRADAGPWHPRATYRDRPQAPTGARALAAACLAAATLAALSAGSGGLTAEVVLPRTASAAPVSAAPVEIPRARASGIDASYPFLPDRADRAPRPDELISMYADGTACAIACRPYGALEGWPLAPFHSQHPIRAGLNELRPQSLHVGVDIQARDGAKVYAVQSGYARILERSGPEARVQVGSYIYWHLDPRVATGQLVTPFRTVLGTVMHGYGHIAFSELGLRGEYVNPLRPGGGVLAPYSDHAGPVIGPPSLSPDGRVLVSAYDPQTFVAQTTYLTPVLAPAALAYRLYTPDGVAVTPLEWAFRGTHLLPFAWRWRIYARSAHAPGYACFATRRICVPNWRYRLAGGLASPLPDWLTPGRYRLTTYAWDWADNETARDATVTLRAGGWVR